MQLNPDDIREITEQVGVPRRGKRLLDVEKVLAMRAAGFPDVQIGEWFGVSKYTVKRRVEEASRAKSRGPAPEPAWPVRGE